MKIKQRQTGFRFSEDTLKKLQKLAANDRRSQNSLVEILIVKEHERVFGEKPIRAEEVKHG